MASIAPTTFADGEPPRFFSPWGKPQGWSKVIPGVWSCHTASHGGWWLTPERLEAMPDELKALTFGHSAPWFEEDSDWALVVRAFPDEFPEAMRCHAEADRLWRERSARLEASRTDNDVSSAITVKPEDFQPVVQALARGQAELGSLILVSDRIGRLAIIRGYDRAQEQAVIHDRYVRIADCNETGLSPDDLSPASYAARCYRPADNRDRWHGPWNADALPAAS